MIRIIIFLGVLLLAALGLSWLADRPGEVALTWQGQRLEVSLLTALALLLVAAVALMALWAVIRLSLRLPGSFSSAGRARRRNKGFGAVSRGMVAVGAGDSRGAQRHAAEASRLLGAEPMTLLLSAQAAQLAGDKPAAAAAFSRMLDMDDARVLGLRGLFIESRRKGDLQAARFYAEEANKLAPGITWVNDAMLDYRVRERDWQGALGIVEQGISRRLIDKPAGRRQRAVLLAAAALEKRATDPSAALALAQESLKLDPALVPSAVLAGRSLAEKGDMGRAASILEAAWKASPHPDLADAYLDVRSGDSSLDRLKRARMLLRLKPADDEGRFAVARAAIAAREYATAREVLQPLAAERPTANTCLLMAQIEESDGGSAGRVREWLSRASRAPRDKAWVADGIVQETWSPYSPITGKLDAFSWMVPPQAPLLTPFPALDADTVLADGNEAPQITVLPPAELSAPTVGSVALSPPAARTGQQNGAEPPVFMPPHTADDPGVEQPRRFS